MTSFRRFSASLRAGRRASLGRNPQRLSVRSRMTARSVGATLSSVSGQGSQLLAFMLLTTAAGIGMVFAGTSKRQLRWRDRSRERRRPSRR